MSLTELISGVEAHEKQLTAFNVDSGTLATLEKQFHDRNLSITPERTPDEELDGFVVLSEDGEFITAAAVEDVVGVAPGEVTPGFEERAYRPILDHLDETMFTSYDIDQMLAASREIEDRAWRTASGSLYSGFQQLSTLSEQLDLYERLAERPGLDVHAYATPDADVPGHDTDLTIHVERAEEIGRSWFVVYDGGGVDVNKCALLAEEREPRSYYGFWTYDPDTVDWIVDHLETTYGLVESA